MKFLSSFSDINDVSRFIYEVGTPGGGERVETPFTNEHLTTEAQKDAKVQEKLKELNDRFSGQLTKEEVSALIREADKEEGDTAENNEDGKLEELKDLERLATLLEAKLRAERAGGEKVDMAELGMEGLTKEEAEKIQANVDKLTGEVEKSFEGKGIDADTIKSAVSEVLKAKGEGKKENLMDEAFVMGLKDEVVAKVEELELPHSERLSRELFPDASEAEQAAIAKAIVQLDRKVVDALKEHKDEDGKPIPGISTHFVDPRIQAKINEKIKELVDSVKGKTPEEALKALEGGSEAIAKAVAEDPIIQTIREGRERAYTEKALTNEALATGVVREDVEDGVSPLDLREGSIHKPEDLKVGEETTIQFPDTENLRTIGAGDLYPPEVRSITINGKAATREGIGGGFFYENGEYAKIVNGDKVVVTGMANSETDEGKELMEELNKMREARAQATKEFQFQLDPSKDRDIEIAPGQKFKQSELVAQMAERYGLDPHLLMEHASEITSQGTDYLKDLNMAARGIQRTLMSSGVKPEDWYITKDGRRYMNPTLLKKFIGGKEEAIKAYIESSGANYEGIKIDGKTMTHEAVLETLNSGGADEGLLMERMSGSTAERVAALATPMKAMASDVLAKFPNLRLTSATREASHNSTIRGASSGSDHQWGAAIDLAGSDSDMRAAQRYLQQTYGSDVWADIHGGTGIHLHVSWRPGGKRLADLGIPPYRTGADLSNHVDTHLREKGII